MKLGHIELFVRDPDTSRRFYEEILGFPVVAVQGDTFIWLNAGGLEVLLRPGATAPSAPAYREAASALVFYTDSLETLASQLKERGVEFREPDGDDCCLTFCDPDGHWLQLVDPGDHQ